MLTRRRFLHQGTGGLSAVALSGALPTVLARAAENAKANDASDRILVVVELAGGNDGLNTFVPFENDLYHEQRPTLAVAKKKVVKLSDQLGLHPKLEPLAALFKDGHLAVVQGVGYPQPDRSHFRSMEIWHTASTAARAPTTGWLGRTLDRVAGNDDKLLPALALTNELPQAFRADKVMVPVMASFESLSEDAGLPSPTAKLLRLMNAQTADADDPVGFLRAQSEGAFRIAASLKKAADDYKSSVEYPDSPLGQQLRRAAQVASAPLGTRVLFVSQDGYDTHASQQDEHANLLGDLAASLVAFRTDLAKLGLADRVVTMVFSEFGRRLAENASFGTDHGAASCMMLVGSQVRGGLIGTYPALDKLDDGDLIFNTDFRAVYATLLDRWLGASSAEVLGAKYEQLELVRS